MVMLIRLMLIDYVIIYVIDDTTYDVDFINIFGASLKDDYVIDHIHIPSLNMEDNYGTIDNSKFESDY